MMDRGQRPDMKLRDVFLAGNFVETLPANSSRYVTQMYEQAKEIEQAYGSYRDALKRGEESPDRKAGAEENELLDHDLCQSHRIHYPVFTHRNSCTPSPPHCPTSVF
jgi:hypothetical protein